MLKFLREERGASAAEYALMLAVISGGVAVATLGLSDSIAVALGRAQSEFALIGGGQPAAVASASSAAGGEAAGKSGKAAALGHGKDNNGQGNAYGKTK